MAKYWRWIETPGLPVSDTLTRWKSANFSLGLQWPYYLTPDHPERFINRYWLKAYELHFSISPHERGRTPYEAIPNISSGFRRLLSGGTYQFFGLKSGYMAHVVGGERVRDFNLEDFNFRHQTATYVFRGISLDDPRYYGNVALIDAAFDNLDALPYTVLGWDFCPPQDPDKGYLDPGFGFGLSYYIADWFAFVTEATVTVTKCRVYAGPTDCGNHFLGDGDDGGDGDGNGASGVSIDVSGAQRHIRAYLRGSTVWVGYARDVLPLSFTDRDTGIGGAGVSIRFDRQRASVLGLLVEASSGIKYYESLDEGKAWRMAVDLGSGTRPALVNCRDGRKMCYFRNAGGIYVTALDAVGNKLMDRRLCIAAADNDVIGADEFLIDHTRWGVALQYVAGGVLTVKTSFDGVNFS